jgi:hypothetical protein
LEELRPVVAAQSSLSNLTALAEATEGFTWLYHLDVLRFRDSKYSLACSEIRLVTDWLRLLLRRLIILDIGKNGYFPVPLHSKFLLMTCVYFIEFVIIAQMGWCV